MADRKDPTAAVAVPVAGNNSNVQKSLEDLESPSKSKGQRFAFACALLASMTSILLGYDIGVMSGAIIYIKQDLNISDVQIEILTGIINLYSLVGSCLAGRTSDWIGRRYTIVFAGSIFFAGALLMGFSFNYPFLMFGRFVAGIGIGYALMIAPVYTAEVSPASSRGFLTSFPEVFINVGILLGYVSNLAFSKLPLRLGWRLMLGIGSVPSVILAVGVLAMPESPRWLVMKGRLGEAKTVLVKTSESKEEALERLADIKAVAGIPEDVNDDVVKVSKKNEGGGVWKEILIHPTPTVRHIVIAALGIHFFQQASGIDAIVLYSPRIFAAAGMQSNTSKLICTVAIGLSKTVCILVSTFFVDRIGRRPILLTSVAGVMLSSATLGVTLSIVDHVKRKLEWAVALVVTMVISYVGFFAMGMGPITWVYSSEIFPLRLRAQGSSMCVVVNRVTSGVISMTFLSLSHGITMGGSFFLFLGIAAIGGAFFFFVLPETQGKTLEEMEGSFGKILGSKYDDKRGGGHGSNGHIQLQGTNGHGNGART